MISQVYGGGGNSGAELTNDFVELFNTGNTSVDVTGWTIQYASAAGSSWDRTSLTGVIQPGQYYLVREAQGNGGTVGLPSADALGGIALSATSGKVALVRAAVLLIGSAPTSADLVDFVGYGTADYSLGQPAPQLSNTLAALRREQGCTNTQNNAADFTTATPTPRNSHSPIHLCSPAAEPVPEITSAGIVSSASYAGSAISPGELITIFGNNLGPATLVSLQLEPNGQYVTTSLGGTRVLINGLPAPLIYASAAVVSAVVPWSAANATTADVQVEFNDRRSTSVAVTVRESLPGIFTLDSSGKNQGAILNQDYSINGPASPAAKGSYITIYATGGGLTTPPSEDARIVVGDPPRLNLSVKVRIGSTEVPVLYAGAAPLAVSGVVQVNVQIPDDFPESGSLPNRLDGG